MINLETIRKNSGKSQQQVATDLGLNEKTYWSYETGRTEPPFDVLLRMADYFRCSTDYLLGHTTQGVMYLDRFSPLQAKAIMLLGKLSNEQLQTLLGYLANMTNTPLDSLF